jgi:hypothetical protein
MSRVIEQVAELGFEKHTTSIGEVARWLLCVLVGVEPRLTSLDNWKRRRSSHNWLLARGRMHFQMFNPA